jgi:hypothetical protein
MPALRATCRALREHVSRPASVQRSWLLRSAALAAWAWELDGFRSAAFLEPEQRTMCMLAARMGSVDALAWLRERGCEWDRDTCAAAAGGGHLAVLQWAREHGCEWDRDTCSAAAGGGHLTVLQWAREHGCEWDRLTCWAAAGRGHLAVLQWAREHGCEWNPMDCWWRADDNGHPLVSAWIRAEIDQ